MKRSSPPSLPESVLIGNAFPLSLVRRPVRILPVEVTELRQQLRRGRVASFWGHANTLPLASALLKTDLEPRGGEERPAIRLDSEGLPTFQGRRYTECFIVTPVLKSGFRPGIGQEVSARTIEGWRALQIIWEPETADLA